MFTLTHHQPTYYPPIYQGSSRRPFHNYNKIPFDYEEPAILLISPSLQQDLDDNHSGGVHDFPWPKISNHPDQSPSGAEKETAEKFVAKLKLPEGMLAEDLKVRVRNNLLSVMGKKFERTDDSATVTTSISRQWTLDEDINTDHVTAVIEQDGTLVITAPKHAKVKEVAVVNAAAPKQNSQVRPSKTKNPVTPNNKNQVPPQKPSDERRPSSPSTPKKKKVPGQPKGTSTTNHVVPFELRVTQNDNANLVVTVQIPDGMSPDDLNIEVKDKVLNISGVQHQEKDGYCTTFERHFVLDERVETDKIAASFDADKRLLTVAAPKQPPVVKTAQKIAIHLITPPKSKPVGDGDHENESVTTSSSINTPEVSDHPPSTDGENSNNITVAVHEEGHEGTKIVVETVADE